MTEPANGKMQTLRAGVLDVAVERHGLPGGYPVVLLHGFPYDPRAFDDVAAQLAESGADVVVPYLRGYGPTRFADPGTIRSGQQAALGHDLFDLIDALGLDRPVVAGYDWGGRAACVLAALWPDRIGGLVAVNGYLIQDIAAATTPQPPEAERRYWYQYYLHGERGRAGLKNHRTELTRLLWQEWSPTWTFSDAELAATTASFENPDFVDIVVHAYRHRYGLVDGDPAYDATERRLAELPVITVPTIVIDGQHDQVLRPRSRQEHQAHFTELVEYRTVEAGHNVPQEAPAEFARAVSDLRRMR